MKNLYKNFGIYFEIGDRVNFILREGYEIIENGKNLPRTITKSKDKTHREIITAEILNYKSPVPDDLYIDCKLKDNINVRIKLSQCQTLELILN